MKKQIAILLSATALLTGLSACSSKPSTDSSTDKKTETVKKSSKSEEKKASSEVKKSSKQSSSEKTDNFDLMIEAAQSQIENLKQQFAGIIALTPSIVGFIPLTKVGFKASKSIFPIGSLA